MKLLASPQGSLNQTQIPNIKELFLSKDWIFFNFFDQSCVISIIRAISFIGVFWQKINCSPFALLAHLLGGWGDEEAKQTGRIKSNSLPINFCQLFKSSLSVVEMIVLFAKMIQCHETYGASESDDSSDDRIIWAKCFQLSTVNNML